jgi:hypothetical protein
MGGAYSTDEAERRGAYRILVCKPDGRDHLEDPIVFWKLILKCIY